MSALNQNQNQDQNLDQLQLTDLLLETLSPIPKSNSLVQNEESTSYLSNKVVSVIRSHPEKMTRPIECVLSQHNWNDDQFSSPFNVKRIYHDLWYLHQYGLYAGCEDLVCWEETVALLDKLAFLKIVPDRVYVDERWRTIDVEWGGIALKRHICLWIEDWDNEPTCHILSYVDGTKVSDVSINMTPKNAWKKVLKIVQKANQD